MSEFTTVEQQYEKNGEMNREDVKVIEDWLGKQNHLPQISGKSNYAFFRYLASASFITISVQFELIFYISTFTLPFWYFYNPNLIFNANINFFT